MKLTATFRFLVLSYVIAAASYAQAPAPVVSQFNHTDPFKLDRGTSFTASGSAQGASGERPAASPTRSRIAADLEEALAVIGRNYAGNSNIDGAVIMRSAIDEMLRSLDPHSNFFDADEYRELLEEQQSEYFGIGATIVNYEREGTIDTFVIASTPGSAAAAAGLAFGDKIFSVDSRAVSGKDSEEVRDLVRGRSGSTVKLGVIRAASGRSEMISLRRGRIAQPSIADAYMLQPGVGYIGLTNGFNFTTSDEFDQAMRNLKRSGLRSLVLDLRGNPGGILEQAVKIAEKFLPAGNLIVSQRGRSAIDNRVWRSANRLPESMPLVVLVDQDSASASEVVAGALQDNDRAMIVGSRTFGKGLVQSVLNLPLGTGLTLTTAKYFTPSGRSIQRDYSDGSLYDYYNHRRQGNSENKIPETAAETVTHRKVYGGDGITPDVAVANDGPGADRLRLADPIFFFCRELVGGSGSRPAIPVDNPEAIASAFERFTQSGWNISHSALISEKQYIVDRIRFNLILAAKGSLAAEKWQNLKSRQTAMAVNTLPNAADLAKRAENTLQLSRKQKTR
ncbi:MAG: S41 family peptidase [Acidobacteriota bacterium]